jgi:hypothetical protein
MRAPTSVWDRRLLLLSPREQRQFWIDLVRKYPLGMAVNCSHMPSLSRTPILRKLVEDGLLLRVREARGGNCNRTVLYCPA